MSALRIANDFGSATLHAQWITRTTCLPWCSGISTWQSQSNLLVCSIYLQIILRKQKPFKSFQHVPTKSQKPIIKAHHRQLPHQAGCVDQASGSLSHLHTNRREKVCCPNHNRSPLPRGGSGGCSPPETNDCGQTGAVLSSSKKLHSEV